MSPQVKLLEPSEARVDDITLIAGGDPVEMSSEQADRLEVLEGVRLEVDGEEHVEPQDEPDEDDEEGDF